MARIVASAKRAEIQDVVLVVDKGLQNFFSVFDLAEILLQEGCQSIERAHERWRQLIRVRTDCLMLLPYTVRVCNELVDFVLKDIPVPDEHSIKLPAKSALVKHSQRRCSSIMVNALKNEELVGFLLRSEEFASKGTSCESGEITQLPSPFQH